MTSRLGRSPNNLSPIERVRWWGWTEVLRVDDLGECWEWNGPKHSAGYGNVRSKTGDGRSTFVRAHRVMLADSGVEVPEELLCLHLCDNPPCIRPSHLMMGDDAENSRQKHERGRGVSIGLPGESNPQSRITNADAAEIRRVYKNGGVRQIDLGRRYGISQTAVSKIILGKMWNKA